MSKESQKYGILLLTHGGWGEKLSETIKMIVGPTENIEEVALKSDDSPEYFYEKVERKVIKMPENSLIITDIVGGTTTNIALLFKKKYTINVLSGLNSMMLIEAIMRQNNPFINESVEKIKEAALQSCQHLTMPGNISN